MLSIEDIKNVSFRRANFGGYKPEDVDAFIDDLQVSYEQIVSERDELKSSVKRLRAQIDRYHSEEYSIKDVILSAKKIAEKSLADAEYKTCDMINKAAESSKNMIEKAREEVSVQKEISERIRTESIKLKRKLEDIYAQHMKIINEIPERPTVVNECDADQSMILESSPGTRDFSPEETVDRIISQESSNSIFSGLDVSENGSENHKFQSSDSVDIKSQSPKCEDSDVNMRSKFENLEFGDNYDVMQSKSNSSGIYDGIFSGDK